MLRDNLQKKNSSQRIKMGIQLDHTQEHISVTKKVSKSYKKRGGILDRFRTGPKKKTLVIGKHRLVFVA